MLIAGEVVAKGGGEGGVLLLLCEVDGLLCDGDGLGVVAGFGVHGSQQLQNFGLVVAGESGSAFELRQGIGESIAGGVGAAEVVVAFG